MARFSYGGAPGRGNPVGRPRIPATPPADGIELSDASLVGLRRRVIHSARGNYVGTETTVHVRGVLNPLATSRLLPGYPSPALPAGPGQVTYTPGVTLSPIPRSRLGPGGTFEAIRNALEQPRRQLWLECGGHVVLYAPHPGFNMDADAGPKCVQCDIYQAHGSKSIVVDLGYVCVTYDAHVYTADTHTILETEQEAHERIDQDGFSTVTITGRALLDAGRLDYLNRLGRTGVVPDDFRNYLVTPPSNGMKRVSLDVTAASNGRELRWTVVDRETSHTVVQTRFGVTRIEATHTGGAGLENVGDAIYGGGMAAAREALRRKEAEEALEKKAPPIPGAGKLLGWGLLALKVIKAANAVIPRHSHTVVARVWGNRRSTREGLRKVAMDVCDDRIDRTIAAAGIGVTGAGLRAAAGVPLIRSVQDDLMGKFCEARVMIQTPPLLNTNFGWPEMPDTEFVRGSAGGGIGGIIISPGSGTNPPLPGQGGTAVNVRGGTVARIAATCLLGAYGTPRAAEQDGPSVGDGHGYTTNRPPINSGP